MLRGSALLLSVHHKSQTHYKTEYTSSLRPAYDGGVFDILRHDTPDTAISQNENRLSPVSSVATPTPGNLSPISTFI